MSQAKPGGALSGYRKLIVVALALVAVVLLATLAPDLFDRAVEALQWVVTAYFAADGLGSLGYGLGGAGRAK